MDVVGDWDKLCAEELNPHAAARFSATIARSLLPHSVLHIDKRAAGTLLSLMRRHAWNMREDQAFKLGVTPVSA